MRIREYTCTQFGKLQKTNIELKDGLNVILGPNEAGKSTIVEGMYSTLFKQHKLTRKSVDIEFIKRYMPKPSGDFIDGELLIENDDELYLLSKNWGSKSQAIMELPSGTIIRDSEAIQEKLRSILLFGEKTYSNIIFSKQQDLKRALDLIMKDAEATNDLSTLLRRVVMELDGISIDKLKLKLQEEYKELFDRWNPELERPENPSKRYKSGMGELLKKYYELQDIKNSIQISASLETQINNTTARIKELEQKKSTISAEIDVYSKIESDIIKRASIEPQLNSLKEREGTLKKIALSWPQQQEVAKHLANELKQTQAEIKKLIEQQGLAQKLQQKERLLSIIAKIEDTHKELNRLNNELANTPKISRGDLKILEELRSTLLTTETAIKAGKMQGQILHSSKGVWVTKDFAEKQIYHDKCMFTANGYLKIELEDNVVIEIQSGEFDFEKLKQTLIRAQNELQEELNRLKIETIEDGKIYCEANEKITGAIESIKKQLATYLEGQSYEELKANLLELEKFKIDRSREEIDKELDIARSKEIEINSKHYSLLNTLKEWEQLYQNPDTILERVIDEKSNIRELEYQVELLAPLPSKFLSTHEFTHYLKKIREDMDQCQRLLEVSKGKYYELERELPENSTEELLQQMKLIEIDYNRLLQKGRSLLKVKSTFERQLEQVDKNSFQPLINSFSKYLTKLTLNNYNTVSIDDNFNVEIRTAEVPMPLDLLSTGAKDCVALALRLAIIEILYRDKSGIVILDDCLVDLDPKRKQMAIEVIQDFAKNNQVIFTTCNPDTARELGGNIINI